MPMLSVNYISQQELDQSRGPFPLKYSILSLVVVEYDVFFLYR